MHGEGDLLVHLTIVGCKLNYVQVFVNDCPTFSVPSPNNHRSGVFILFLSIFKLYFGTTVSTVCLAAICYST